MLSTLDLSAAQWRVVAEGGEQIGNNAIRDVALGKARELEYLSRSNENGRQTFRFATRR
jgi:hypothetical protein